MASEIFSSRGTLLIKARTERDRLKAINTDLLAALEKLIAADNCNYEAQTMRTAGYFDQARTAVAKAQSK